MLQYGKYYKALDDGFSLSIDSVIAEYKLVHNGGGRLLDLIQKKLLWQYQYFEAFGGIGRFRHCFTFDFGQDSTVSLLIGFYGASGAVDLDTVRIDFNPNKVLSSCSELQELLLFLRMNAKYSKIVRWDLAYDMPFPRRDFVLIRSDNRKRAYEELSQDNYTEYLGRRNSPGRFKLYNKALESNLSFPLTRSELTCSGEWSSADVLKHLPLLYRFEPFADDGVKQSGVDELSAFAALLIRHPEEAVYLDWFNWRKKKSLQSILAQCSADSSSVHDRISSVVLDDLYSSLCADILS